MIETPLPGLPIPRPLTVPRFMLKFGAVPATVAPPALVCTVIVAAPQAWPPRSDNNNAARSGAAPRDVVRPTIPLLYTHRTNGLAPRKRRGSQAGAGAPALASFAQGWGRLAALLHGQCIGHCRRIRACQSRPVVRCHRNADIARESSTAGRVRYHGCLRPRIGGHRGEARDRARCAAC